MVSVVDIQDHLPPLVLMNWCKPIPLEHPIASASCAMNAQRGKPTIVCFPLRPDIIFGVICSPHESKVRLATRQSNE
jgi:hypothetical protein